MRVGQLDVPNARSSHSRPTPRGGGIAIVLASILAWTALVALGAISVRLYAVLLVTGLAVATVGFVDDRRGLSAGVRILVHVAVAALVVASMGGLDRLHWKGEVIHLGWVGSVTTATAIVWFINLFNFMDGIDGLAGSEALFVCAAASAMLCFTAGDSGLVYVAACLAASAAGFLWWNWPPAKIFMGDVGSGFLGAVIALLLVASARTSRVNEWTALILCTLFFVDATVTLIRRALRGESLPKAHRTHAYQWLSRRWKSHARVTLTFLAINACVLLPAAYLSLRRPEMSVAIAAVVTITFAAVAWMAGAGKAERASAGES
jgi:Fuc2NAc and GlcNAc transferase